MEEIRIRNDKDTTIIYLENNEYWGYKFYDNGKIESVNEDVFKYFDIFKLSEDRIELAYEGKYQVVLDNKTKFKHYFLNESENYIMFFQNNGEDVISYLEENEKENKPIIKDTLKKFRFGKQQIIISLKGWLISIVIVYALGSLIITPAIAKPITKPIINQLKYVEDITVDDLRDKIYLSSNLSREEKDYLYNEEFFNDILPTINGSNYLKYMYNLKFNEISIVGYGEKDRMYEFASGYYNLLNPSNLNISDYDGLEQKKDTISHEFVHLCQDEFQYRLICEACAEIISHEYYPNAENNSYQAQVYLVKKLMEIIGSKPIWEYTLTGNFDLIEGAVKPYLTDEEYNTFLECLRFKSAWHPNYSEEEKKRELSSLDNILNTLYQNIYGVSIENDEAISLLSNPTLVRYYFNRRYINQENSYYDVIVVEEKEMPAEEAVKNEYVFIKEIKAEKVRLLSYDDYVNGNYDSDSEIVFSTNQDKNVILCYNTAQPVITLAFKYSKKSYIPPISYKFLIDAPAIASKSY